MFLVKFQTVNSPLLNKRCIFFYTDPLCVLSISSIVQGGKYLFWNVIVSLWNWMKSCKTTSLSVVQVRLYMDLSQTCFLCKFLKKHNHAHLNSVRERQCAEPQWITFNCVQRLVRNRIWNHNTAIWYRTVYKMSAILSIVHLNACTSTPTQSFAFEVSLIVHDKVWEWGWRTSHDSFWKRYLRNIYMWFFWKFPQD